MKKLLSLILAVSLLLTGSALADELRLKYLDPSLYPVAEGAELDIWCGQDGNVANYEVNPQTAALEELTGVKINWTTAPGTQEDMNVMFNLHIASGNYPDMYLNTLSTADIIEYANDVFIPLNDYIENTRWIKEYLEAMPEIPISCGFTSRGSRPVGWICRKRWMNSANCCAISATTI